MAKNGNGSWIARCKAYMKQHGCQLGEAMKALSNKNKGKGKSFRGGNAEGVAHNAEAFEDQGAPAATSAPPPPPAPPANAGGNALEHLGSMFEVGGTPSTMKVMDGGRRRKTQKKRGGRKARSGSRSRSRSRSRRHRHRSRRGGSGSSSSLSFSEYK